MAPTDLTHWCGGTLIYAPAVLAVLGVWVHPPEAPAFRSSVLVVTVIFITMNTFFTKSHYLHGIEVT